MCFSCRPVPDGKKVSYFLHQEQGDKADLYYIDVTSGKPAVLVASEKIAAMKPPVTGTKDDREKDNRERYHVAVKIGRASCRERV